MDPLSALCNKERGEQENDKRGVIDNESQESKARYSSSMVAYRWAGAIMKVNRAYTGAVGPKLHYKSRNC